MLTKIRQLFKRNPTYEYVTVHAHEIAYETSDPVLAKHILDQALICDKDVKPLRAGFDPKKTAGFLDLHTDCPGLRDEILRLLKKDTGLYKTLTPYFIHNYTAGFYRQVSDRY